MGISTLHSSPKISSRKGTGNIVTCFYSSNFIATRFHKSHSAKLEPCTNLKTQNLAELADVRASSSSSYVSATQAFDWSVGSRSFCSLYGIKL